VVGVAEPARLTDTEEVTPELVVLVVVEQAEVLVPLEPVGVVVQMLKQVLELVVLD
jgi:hypothetical protein